MGTLLRCRYTCLSNVMIKIVSNACDVDAMNCSPSRRAKENISTGLSELRKSSMRPLAKNKANTFRLLYTEREDALQSVVLQRHYKLAMSFSLNNNKNEYGLSISCCRDKNKRDPGTAIPHIHVT